MTARLFGVSTVDAAAFGFSALALLVVAVTACAGPARRAASIDPARALQSE